MASTVDLVVGGDAELLGDKARSIIDALVGDGDRSLMVEELVEEGYHGPEGHQIAPLVDAAQTPPFLTERRVVVGRHLARFTTKDVVAPLVDYLADPLETTSLVLVWDKGPDTTHAGAVPKSLREAVQQAGGQIHDASVPRGRAVKGWFTEQITASGIHLEPAASAAVQDHLGDQYGRLPGLLDQLLSVFGPDARISETDVRQYLGQAGDVPPWELTDAIADGDIAMSLDRLHRMMTAGERHPLQIMATLITNYTRLLRLDGAGVGGEKAAAALLGIKGSSFPAKKALRESRRLGGDKIRHAITLLARADLDLRGGSGLGEQAVMEVLVARLARLSR